MSQEIKTLRVLLTTPHREKIIEPLYDEPLFVRNSLASIAAYIRNEPYIKIKCCDAKFEGRDLDSLLSIIKSFKPDIIGISSFTYEIEDAGVLALAVKNVLPETLIVVGGSHISAIPEQTMSEFQAFDIGVIGEAEETFKELCCNLKNSTGLNNVDGIVFRQENGQILKTVERNKISNLSVLPMPAWDLLPKAKEYFIQTTRGCPFNCNFCFNPNGNILRKRYVEDIIYEIEWLINNVQPKRISFGDEAFGADTKFAFNLLDKMISLNIGKRVLWDIQTHVSFITEELVCKMKKANIQRIEMGVESGNNEILKRMGKGINKKKIIRAFDIVKKYKIKSGAFLIFGHPNETRNTIKESINFVAKLNPTEPVFAIMVPFPGTKIATYVQNGQHGYKACNVPWRFYRKQINGALKMKNITPGKLKQYLIIANLWVFMRNFRLWSLIKFSIKHGKSIVSFIKTRNYKS